MWTVFLCVYLCVCVYGCVTCVLSVYLCVSLCVCMSVFIYGYKHVNCLVHVHVCVCVCFSISFVTVQDQGQRELSTVLGTLCSHLDRIYDSDIHWACCRVLTVSVSGKVTTFYPTFIPAFYLSGSCWKVGTSGAGVHVYLSVPALSSQSGFSDGPTEHWE